MNTSKIQAQVQTLAIELAARLAEIDRQVAASRNVDAFYLDVAHAVNACALSLGDLNFWGSDNRLPSSELWNVAGQWLARGWLQNHARTKPRGYAGDHEMLTRIYEHSLCRDPLGRLFDRYFQVQAAPQAVRNRMRMMTQWISEAIQAAQLPGQSGVTKVAIFGSAFGIEIREALAASDQSSRQSIHAVLLDLDPAAVDFAAEQLRPLLPPPQLTLKSTNLFRLPDRPRVAAELTGTNLLLCPGLFDYLDDAAAESMTRFLFSQLAPGGKLVVFQFAPHNPTRAYMEWFGNWYLTYRNAAAFRELIIRAVCPGATVEFGAEQVGIDLYVKIMRDT